MTTGQGQRCHHVVSNVHHDHDGSFNISHDSRIIIKVREASEDPDLFLYLEENVHSLTPTDIAGLLDYQVPFERQNISLLGNHKERANHFLLPC